MSETEFAIGRYCGVTFAGLKVASMVNLRRGERDVVVRLARGFRRRGFCFVCLRACGERRVLYVYHEERLRGLQRRRPGDVHPLRRRWNDIKI